MGISNFRMSPFTSENYLTWFNESEVFLQAKKLWKHVDDDGKPQIDEIEAEAAK